MDRRQGGREPHRATVAILAGGFIGARTIAAFRLLFFGLTRLANLVIASLVLGASELSASYTGPAGFNINPAGGGVEFDGNNPVINTLYKFTVVLRLRLRPASEAGSY
jgi:hypothetical protein